MGLGTLTDRISGQTILATFYNDIHAAMNGDFVGRNSSGIPTTGQNLGTVALPWGILNCQGINVNGASVDPSLTTTPQNIVISGKARSTSRQAAYITPNGAALSCIIAGATTNLSLNINGSTVAVTTDITKSSLTAAAASNNTCTLNDSTAAGQADTKRWGGAGHRKDSFTVASMGSSITALVGKWAAFKTGAEYFLAFVESTTKLSKIRRGYFYDSSLNPLNPVALTNSDTITLMNLGFLFVENNGTTVDVSYTMPVYDYTAPSAPAAADYWYDLQNRTWKRYDGSSFQIINRTYVGMVVNNTTQCIAARAEEFYQNYKDTLDLDFELVSSTVVRSNWLNGRVNVYGKDIDFSLTALSFDITTNLASSVDMYNSTEQASTLYYLYISDLGEKKISDIEPLYFGNKLGWYHPHNTWRCVGLAYNDGSSNLVTVNAKGSRRCSLYLYTANGHGSTNTKIRRLTNTRASSYGASALYADSSTLGTTITIQEAGFYDVMIQDRCDSGSAPIGVSLNSTQLTTAITSINQEDRMVFCDLAVTTQFFSIAVSIFCKVGDVLRHHTDGVPAITGNVSFTVQKVGGFLDAPA